MKLITNAIVTKFVEYFFLWDIHPSCDAMLHIVMSCWLLWCHVGYCDVMLVIAMSCCILWCHVAHYDFMFIVQNGVIYCKSINFRCIQFSRFLPTGQILGYLFSHISQNTLDRNTPYWSCKEYEKLTCRVEVTTIKDWHK